jgi:hypothetical protein
VRSNAQATKPRSGAPQWQWQVEEERGEQRNAKRQPSSPQSPANSQTPLGRQNPDPHKALGITRGWQGPGWAAVPPGNGKRERDGILEPSLAPLGEGEKRRRKH